jgi:hypothetical protein
MDKFLIQPSMAKQAVFDKYRYRLRPKRLENLPARQKGSYYEQAKI